MGQPLHLAVLSASADARTLTVTAKAAAVVAARSGGSSASGKGSGDGGASPLPIRALKPGGLVSATVVRVVENGLVVAFKAGPGPAFRGVIEQNHFAAPCKKEHW